MTGASTESLLSNAGFTGSLFFLNILPKKLVTSSSLGFGTVLSGSASFATVGFCSGFFVSTCAGPLSLQLSTSSFFGGFDSFVMVTGGVSLFCSTAAALLATRQKKMKEIMYAMHKDP